MESVEDASNSRFDQFEFIRVLFRDVVVDVLKMDARSQAMDLRKEDRERLDVMDAL